LTAENKQTRKRRYFAFPFVRPLSKDKKYIFKGD
jgi:hypothetical protein